MRKGDDLLLDLEEQMQTIKLPLMALKLDELYRSPKYLNMDKLDFLSELLAPEIYTHNNWERGIYDQVNFDVYKYSYKS